MAKTGAEADSAKASKVSSSNVEAGEASDPAGSESAPQVEPQAAAPEADVVIPPPSSTAAAPPSVEAQTEAIPTDSAAAPNPDNAEAAAPNADNADAAAA